MTPISRRPQSLRPKIRNMDGGGICTNALLCPTLCVGTILSFIDCYFDAGFVLTGDSRPMLRYYNWVLNPSLKPVPWPGFVSVALIFTPHLTYCLSNSLTIAGMYIFYAPVCYRYYGLVKKTDSLRHWWTVVVLRVILFSLGVMGLREEGCMPFLSQFLGFGSDL